LNGRPKNVITNSFSHFSNTETSLVSITAPKLTHCPWVKAIFALTATSAEIIATPCIRYCNELYFWIFLEAWPTRRVKIEHLRF